jgi:predicted DNA-binding protein
MKERKTRLAGTYVTPELSQRLKAYCSAAGLPESTVVERALEQHLAGLSDVAVIVRRIEALERAASRLHEAVEVCGESLLVWVATSCEGADSMPTAPLANLCRVQARGAGAFVRRLTNHVARGRPMFAALIAHARTASG